MRSTPGPRFFNRRGRQPGFRRDHPAGGRRQHGPRLQISPGSCPAPDFVLENTADNGAGTIDYAATQLNPTPPCGSGFILQAAFQCVGLGTSDIQIVSSLLGDPDGLAIPHTTQDGQVTCEPNPPEAVCDLAASTTGADVSLAWSAATQDTGGGPIAIAQYIVHRNTEPYFTPDGLTVRGTTASAGYVDAGAAGSAAAIFFYLVLAESTTGLVSAGSNRVGEFDFALLPGVP